MSTPFPRQLESSGLTREFSAFVSCLEDIPSMREVRGCLASSLCLLELFRIEKNEYGHTSMLVAPSLQRPFLHPFAGGASATRPRKPSAVGCGNLACGSLDLRSCCPP